MSWGILFLPLLSGCFRDRCSREAIEGTWVLELEDTGELADTDSNTPPNADIEGAQVEIADRTVTIRYARDGVDYTVVYATGEPTDGSDD